MVLRPAIILGVYLFFGSATLDAQIHILSAESTSAIPGATVPISVLLDNDELARGFSLGMTHDGTILTLDSITEGAALLDSNGGVGPDFFFEDIAAPNGPGGTCGAVLSFIAPLDDIPIGSGSELAIFTYTVASAAEPGTSSSLDFVDTLGSPPLETIISVAGVTRIPTVVSGAVLINTASVTTLGCALTDLCTCEFTMTWTNHGPYDTIEIQQDGIPIQTLAGTATTTTVNRIVTTIGGPSVGSLTVIARRNLVISAPANCLASCPDVPDPIEPTGPNCVVDHFTGVTTLSWTNAQLYTGLSVTVDGVPAASLGGTEVTTAVTLPTPGLYSICLDGTDECGVAFSTVCCAATFEQIFVRGDANADNSYNISDPIFGLNFLFAGGPLPCQAAFDVNDTGETNIADVIFALQGIFGVGSLPPAPFPGCGIDPTPSGISCNSFPVCP